MSNKHLVLFSGGLDSLVLLWDLHNTMPKDEEIRTLQINQYEKSKYGHHQYRLIHQGLSDMDDTVRKRIKSSQIRVDMSGRSHQRKNDSIKKAYIPGRNLVLLASAMQFALFNKYTHIYIGCHEHPWYNDCTQHFIDEFQSTAHMGYAKHSHGDIPQIKMPFKRMSKADILKKLWAYCGKEEKAFIWFLHNTETCPIDNHSAHYWGNGCGICVFCERRKEAVDEFCKQEGVNLTYTNRWSKQLELPL